MSESSVTLLPSFLQAVVSVFRRHLVNVWYQMWSTDTEQSAVTTERTSRALVFEVGSLVCGPSRESPQIDEFILRVMPENTTWRFSLTGPSSRRLYGGMASDVSYRTGGCVHTLRRAAAATRNVGPGRVARSGATSTRQWTSTPV